MNSPSIHDSNHQSHKTYTNNLNQPTKITNSEDKGMNRRQTNNIGNDSCLIISEVDSNMIMREAKTVKNQVYKTTTQ